VREASLNPTVLRRISASLRPDWTRTVLARRFAAAGLVMLAGVAALRPDPAGELAAVVVAARDLTPGSALTADDVRIETRLATTIPDGSQANLGAVVGSTLAGPARRGEATAGPGARIVPLHLADNALIDLIRVGDVVDILAAPTTDARADSQAVAKVVATDAVVVLVSAKGKVRDADSERVVLVALPARVANTVAGSALGQAVTLTLH
jgi:Flp pilus assembly protein CpaB